MNGIKKMEKNYRNDYSKLLPLFIYSDDKISKSISPEMNKTIEKVSKLINRHSITEKPKKKKKKKLSKKEKDFLNKKEYTKYVDDAYLLMGKAHFHKHDFYPAIETFEYVIKEYSENDIKYSAFIWLSRTYIELKNFKEAKSILDQLDGDKAFPKEYKHDYQLTLANYYLTQKQYSDAIPLLRKAAQNETQKNKKARYYYILAQLSELNEQYDDASYNFAQVIKLNPSYEMSFNARINEARLFNVNASGGKDIKKELQKMLKDDKNIEYQDQIYYALGKIYQKEGNLEQAIESFKQSVLTSVSNDGQKAISFLAIADYYFAIPNYRIAQIYYDSAVVFINTDFPDYNSIYNKSKSLNELVENLNIVETEDSLQRVAALSKEDRNKLIANIIENVKEEELKKQEEEKQNSLLQGMQQTRNPSATASGKWYFYNPSAIGLGQSEFTKIWGRRKLEDNWRRKNKSKINIADNEENSTATDSVANKYNNKQPEYYLQNLPLTDSLLAESNKQIAEAMLNMARVYKEKLKDYEHSIKIFKELNKRFPDNENALSVYYYLYLLNNEIENKDAAEYYKRLIASEYPESQYASILTNPNYFKELEEKEKAISNFYDSTYNLYLAKNYDAVLKNYSYADSVYNTSKLMPKFLYLKTLVTGRTKEKDEFKKELELLTEKYPDSEVAPEAENILAYLNRDEPEKEPEKVDVFNNEGTETAKDTVAKEIYTYNKRSTHFYMIIVENKKTDINQIKFGISNFNIDYFSTLEFNVSSALLNNDFQFVTVKSFKNKNQAMNYYESISEFGDFFKNLDKGSYRHFIISSENFVKFYKDKNIANYYKFFKENYLD